MRPPKLLFEELEQSPVQIVTGDLSDEGYCKELFAANDGGPLSVFHLGASASGQGLSRFLTSAWASIYAARCRCWRPHGIVVHHGRVLSTPPLEPHLVREHLQIT